MLLDFLSSLGDSKMTPIQESSLDTLHELLFDKELPNAVMKEHRVASIFSSTQCMKNSQMQKKNSFDNTYFIPSYPIQSYAHLLLWTLQSFVFISLPPVCHTPMRVAPPLRYTILPPITLREFRTRPNLIYSVTGVIRCNRLSHYSTQTDTKAL